MVKLLLDKIGHPRAFETVCCVGVTRAIGRALNPWDSPWK